MGHKHTKAEILDGALAAAFDDGLEPAHLRARRQAARHQRPGRRLLLPHEGRPDRRGAARDGVRAAGDARPDVHHAGGRPPRARPHRLADPGPPRRRPGLRAVLRGRRARRRRPRAVPHARPEPRRRLDRLGRRAPQRPPAADGPRPRRPSPSSTACSCSASSRGPPSPTGPPSRSWPTARHATADDRPSRWRWSSSAMSALSAAAPLM